MPALPTVAQAPRIIADDVIAGCAMFDAGFPMGEIATAIAVALAESSPSGNCNSISPPNDNGTYDYGLWQINSVHADILSQGNWANPHDNAKMAKQIWQAAGGKWSPWSAYNNGRYRMYLERANFAILKGPTTDGQTYGDAIASTVTAPIRGMEALASFATKLTNPKTWATVGFIWLGAILLIVVGIKLVMQSDTAKQAVDIAGDVIPGGGVAKKIASKGMAKTAVQGAKAGAKTAVQGARAGTKTVAQGAKGMVAPVSTP